jgi:aspartate-semialdehyde dehydrogenase
VETQEPVAPEIAAAALTGERIRVRKPSQDSPTPVEVTGSRDILVDSIAQDADHSNGLWIWAVADNLHLAARNAVEIAESLHKGTKS